MHKTADSETGLDKNRNRFREIKLALNNLGKCVSVRAPPFGNIRYCL